ncbi:hypothetical protein O3M35_008943 [Rhynocoris fuscipes]|uniref:Uncharacterized protein n=1 Tax=Rhynocoris fuscipes TaxID=488301 RepID=A0AAW1D221_9HEMI
MLLPRGLITSIEADIVPGNDDLSKETEFLWIEGHSALNNNEKVDLLAKEAAVTGEVMDIRLPWSDLKGKAKRHAINRWQAEYYSSEKSRFYKKNFRNVNIPPWFRGLGMNKHLVSTISRIRTDHAICGAYIYKILQRSSPTCRNLPFKR